MGQFDFEGDKTREHHELEPSAVKKHYNVVDNIKESMLKHENTFAAVGDKLRKVIIHAYTHYE